MIRQIICTATSRPIFSFWFASFYDNKKPLKKLPELRYPDRQLWSEKAEHWRASCRVNRFSRWWKVVGLVLWEHFDAPVLFVSKKSKNLMHSCKKHMTQTFNDWLETQMLVKTIMCSLYVAGVGKDWKTAGCFLNMYQTGDPTYKMGPKSSEKNNGIRTPINSRK